MHFRKNVFIKFQQSLLTLNELDMSTARRRLKSPQSLYDISTHPTMITHRSRSWSWMIDYYPFRSMSISLHYPPPHPNPTHSTPTPNPQIRLSKTVTLRIQGQGHGWGQRSMSHSSPSIATDASPFRFTSIGPTIPEICSIECLTLKKHIRNFQRKSVKKEFPTEFLKSLIRW